MCFNFQHFVSYGSHFVLPVFDSGDKDVVLVLNNLHVLNVE